MKIRPLVTYGIKIRRKSQGVIGANLHADAALAAGGEIQLISGAGFFLFPLPFLAFHLPDRTGGAMPHTDAAGNTGIPVRVFPVGQELGMTAKTRADLDQFTRLLGSNHRLEKGLDGNP